MTALKINIYTILLTISIFISCNQSSSLKTSDSIKVDHQDSSTYCFEAIRDSLNEIGLLDIENVTTTYLNKNEKESLSVLFVKNNYRKEVEEFYEYSNKVEAFILTNQRVAYLILIGQAKGATGSGVDYWNYQCFRLSESIQITEFASLSKNPHSIFLNKENNLCYIEILDNYPRPASARVELDYTPLVVSVKDAAQNKDILEIEYHCLDK
jgi:hypothetical protein